MERDLSTDFNSILRLSALIRPHIRIVLGALLCDVLKPAVTIVIGVCGVLLLRQVLLHTPLSVLFPLIGLMILLALFRACLGM